MSTIQTSYTRLLFAALLVTSSCTDVTENFSDTCTPQELRCDEGRISVCKDDGTGFVSYKTCNPDSLCELNEEGVPTCEGSGGGGACKNNAQCAEQLGELTPCQEATCTDGICSVVPKKEGTECDDASACTQVDICVAGMCRGETVSCDDGNQCTADTCDPEKGCAATNDDSLTCDDGKPCTVSDACKDGSCKGTDINCDDDNPCTEDFCDQGTGECKHTPAGGSCDDGDNCTKKDQCESGICVGQASYPCQLDEDCLEACGSVDPCKGTYFCAPDGFCRTDVATAFPCPESGLGACEFSKCFNEGGEPQCKTLQHPDGIQCDDSSDCTENDLCTNGACVGTIDPTVPGCAYFRLKSWLFGPAQQTSNESYKLKATFGQSQFSPTGKGAASNEKYKLKAWSIGL